jgi:quinol-cytochrome oxidoreductase complex cytochrome b subunit
MSNLLHSVYSWVDERLGLGDLEALVKHKTVPQHAHSFWYYWGGLSLLFFLVQVFTGVLLLIYYRPGPDAYESVRQITYDTNFGWLIRSVHSWGANLMIATVGIHMFSVYFMKAYRKPREFGWWTGLMLLGLAMVFGFSGYLLPMDQLAFFATKVGLDIPSQLPVLGPRLAALVRGGFEVNEYTVQRFFALHAVILPALFVPLLGLHLYLVQKHGNAMPPSEERKPAAQRQSIPFFPNFLMKDLAMWLVAINVLAVLASLYPWDLGPQADPIKPAPIGIHPEWYFMSQFQVLKILGDWIPGKAGEFAGMGLFTVAIVAWMLVPFYDANNQAGRRARNATCFGLLLLLATIVTTIWGYLAI